MIVAHDRHRFDASRHEKVHQHRLELRLTRLEVIATDEGVLPFGQLKCARHERVLWRAVDVSTLQEYKVGQ